MNEIQFPHPSEANPDGLLAMGGDLQPQTLINAYAKGIFPWFNDGQPILWWSPDPRFVLFPDKLIISKSMRKELRLNRFEVTFDLAFEEVIKQCALVERPGQLVPPPSGRPGLPPRRPRGCCGATPSGARVRHPLGTPSDRRTALVPGHGEW